MTPPARTPPRCTTSKQRIVPLQQNAGNYGRHRRRRLILHFHLMTALLASHLLADDLRG